MSREPEKLLEDVSVFIAESRKLMAQGAFVQLAGMDKQIRTLCDEVLKLSADQRAKYADRLQALFAEVQMLGKAMEAEKDSVLREMGGLNKHKKANVAYKVSDNLDNRGKREDKK